MLYESPCGHDLPSSNDFNESKSPEKKSTTPETFASCARLIFCVFSHPWGRLEKAILFNFNNRQQLVVYLEPDIPRFKRHTIYFISRILNCGSRIK